jgi:rod shape-determining protein MreC
MLTGVIALIVVIVAVQFFAPHFFPNLFTSIVRPFWRMEFSVGSGSLRSTEHLLSENEELKRQLTSVDIRIQSASALEAENIDLRKMLGRASSTTFLVAAVLKRPPLAAYDELVIDAGRDYTIASGTPVYSPEHVRIGTITDVLAQTAKVKLLSSPGEKYEVLIGITHEPATAMGRGGGQYEAKVPHEAKVEEGDAVFTSSADRMPLGTVTAKIFDPTEPFGKILFAPMVNIYKLRWVLVEKPS